MPGRRHSNTSVTVEPGEAVDGPYALVGCASNCHTHSRRIALHFSSLGASSLQSSLRATAWKSHHADAQERHTWACGEPLEWAICLGWMCFKSQHPLKIYRPSLFFACGTLLTVFTSSHRLEVAPHTWKPERGRYMAKFCKNLMNHNRNVLATGGWCTEGLILSSIRLIWMNHLHES